MMHLFSLLLLSVILMQSCSKVIIFVNYEINKKQITEQYCVNKSNKSLHCDGMCHVIIQLQKEEKQETTPVKNQNDKFEIILFSSVEDDLLFTNYITGDYAYSILQIIKIKSSTSSIFHPPSC